MAKRSAADRVRAYLEREGISPERLGGQCDPPITGQSVRDVLRGRPVGRKVARAISDKVGIALADLILPGEGRAA